MARSSTRCLISTDLSFCRRSTPRLARWKEACAITNSATYRRSRIKMMKLYTTGCLRFEWRRAMRKLRSIRLCKCGHTLIFSYYSIWRPSMLLTGTARVLAWSRANSILSNELNTSIGSINQSSWCLVIHKMSNNSTSSYMLIKERKALSNRNQRCRAVPISIAHFLESNNICRQW